VSKRCECSLQRHVGSILLLADYTVSQTRSPQSQAIMSFHPLPFELNFHLPHVTLKKQTPYLCLQVTLYVLLSVNYRPNIHYWYFKQCLIPPLKQPTKFWRMDMSFVRCPLTQTTSFQEPTITSNLSIRMRRKIHSPKCCYFLARDVKRVQNISHLY